MVRLHTQIAPSKDNSAITDVNQSEIDGIWRFVAAAKKEGIYTTISPYWASEKPAQKWGLKGYEAKTGLYGLLFFNETLQNAYKGWVKALYTPKNPYTGIPLSREPAVGIIQVQNEDSLLFWTTQSIKPEQQAILAAKFVPWLQKKYGSLDTAKTAWKGAASPTDDWASGKVGLIELYQLTVPQTGGMAQRTSDQTQFFAETQHRFYEDMANFYRNDLGCKQLINASNWITADPVRLNDVERWTYTADDVLAVNRYTGGVHIGENNGWRLDPGHHFTNRSNLLDIRSLPTNLKQVVGHPMLITESSWVNPEGYQAEGPFLIAAYESLTGVDGFYWFSATAPEYETNPYFDFANLAGGQHPMVKWSASVPALMGNFPANALLFRKGYLKQGSPVVHEERALNDLWERKMPLIAEDRSFDPNRMTGNTGEKSNVKAGINPLAFLVGPVEVKYGGTNAQTTVGDLSRYIDEKQKVIQSVTGEVRLNYGTGICIINAPKAQGVTGFLSKVAGPITLGDVSIQSSNEYAAVSIVSLDDAPLKTSRKILVQIGTMMRPTGWQQKEADFKSDDGKETFHGYEIVNTGRMPFRATNVDVNLSVGNSDLKKATLLDSAGYAVALIEGTKQTGGKFTLKLPQNAMYVILE